MMLNQMGNTDSTADTDNLCRIIVLSGENIDSAYRVMVLKAESVDGLSTMTILKREATDSSSSMMPCWGAYRRDPRLPLRSQTQTRTSFIPRP